MAKGTSGFDSGGSAKGLSVTINGDTTQYIFYKKSGQNFYQRGIGGTPEPTPQNMSVGEFERRVASNGAKVVKISQSEIKKMEKARKEDRKKSEKFLDEQWYKAAPKPRKGMRGH